MVARYQGQHDQRNCTYIDLEHFVSDNKSKISKRHQQVDIYTLYADSPGVYYDQTRGFYYKLLLNELGHGSIISDIQTDCIGETLLICSEIEQEPANVDQMILLCANTPIYLLVRLPHYITDMATDISLTYMSYKVPQPLKKQLNESIVRNSQGLVWENGTIEI